MSKFKWDNLIMFAEHLSSATSMNLPIDKTVKTMSHESDEKGWRNAQESVAELVELGSPLSEAMGNYPKYFPPIMRRMVQAGEEGKVLQPMLAAISGYLQSAREIEQRLRKCMVYPIIVWTILLINCAIFFYVVVPRLYSMIESIGADTNQFGIFNLTGLGLFLLLTSVSFLFAWLIIGTISNDLENESGKGLSRFGASLPFLGGLQRHARAAHVCEILGILVKGGNSIRESINIAKNAITNPLTNSALDDVEMVLASEKQDFFKPRKTLIPGTTLWMLSQNENASELGDRLLSIADMHRRQLQIQVSFVRDIIEPTLLIIVAVIGGIGIVAMYGPILNILNIFNQIRM